MADVLTKGKGVWNILLFCDPDPQRRMLSSFTLVCLKPLQILQSNLIHSFLLEWRYSLIKVFWEIQLFYDFDPHGRMLPSITVVFPKPLNGFQRNLVNSFLLGRIYSVRKGFEKFSSFVILIREQFSLASRKLQKELKRDLALTHLKHVFYSIVGYWSLPALTLSPNETVSWLALVSKNPASLIYGN